MSKVKKNSEVIGIIECKGILFNKTQCSCLWELVQLKVFLRPPKIKGYNIKEDSDEELQEKTENHEFCKHLLNDHTFTEAAPVSENTVLEDFDETILSEEQMVNSVDPETVENN